MYTKVIIHSPSDPIAMQCLENLLLDFMATEVKSRLEKMNLSDEELQLLKQELENPA